MLWLTRHLFWDGAFAVARTTNPNEEDRTLYCRFVNAAVYSHVRIGCNVTHKVHLMWGHVAKQMRNPGGLGEKMEDWVELQHQSGCRERRRFRTTQNIAVRAKARARSNHRSTNPNVIARKNEVKSEFTKAPNSENIKISVVRKEEREARRMAALEDFERYRSIAALVPRHNSPLHASLARSLTRSP